MALNINDAETCRMAEELAQLTGETIAAAVTTAVRERHERLFKSREKLAERLLEIGRECAAHWKEPYKSMDHGDLLHDDKGLPK